MKLPHTIIAITVKQMIASISRNWVNLFDGIAHCGKEQTMSRWICIDDICVPSDENDWEELVAFADAIAEQEPIDIVRCGECKYTDGEPPIVDGRSWCILHGCFMYYCSDGEREGE